MASITFGGTDLSGSSYGLLIDGFSIPSAMTGAGESNISASADRAVFSKGRRVPGRLNVECFVQGTSITGLQTQLANIRGILDVAEEKKLIFSYQTGIAYYAIPLSDMTNIDYLGCTARFTIPFYLAHSARFSAPATVALGHTSGQTRSYTIEGNDYTPRAVLTITANGGETGDLTIANATTGESVTIADALLVNQSLVYDLWTQTALVGTTSRIEDISGILTSLKNGANSITVTTELGFTTILSITSEGASNP
jgi:phage-related protein